MSPLRVVVAGGGVAAMEAILALRELAGERVELTMLAPESTFAYRPMAVAVPFARGRVQRLPLAEFARETSTRLVRGSLTAVAPGHAISSDGPPLPFDALLVAVGAWSEPAVRGATTWTPDLDQEVMGGLLADIEEGYVKRVAFVVPDGAGWPLPAYELALMTAWDARDMGQDDVAVSVYTPEAQPLEIFGEQASQGLRSDLEEAGVTVHAGTTVQEDPDAPARLLAGGEPLDSQRVIALPRAIASGVGGLPVDERGFIRVDAHGRVEGVPGVWAAGDAIAFPVKQGGLAAQQAGAAAESIAAEAGADVTPSPFHPVLRGVLLTGRGSQWIRRDLGGEDTEGESERHALWWPPTKVAGRYLAPYLAKLDEQEFTDADRPAGRLIEFTVEGHGR
jgi:sulfide:quinone oxidoreductase